MMIFHGEALTVVVINAGGRPALDTSFSDLTERMKEASGKAGALLERSDLLLAQAEALERDMTRHEKALGLKPGNRQQKK